MNGAVRTDEQAHMARLLRDKSKVRRGVRGAALHRWDSRAGQPDGRADILAAAIPHPPFVDNPEGGPSTDASSARSRCRCPASGRRSTPRAGRPGGLHHAGLPAAAGL